MQQYGLVYIQRTYHATYDMLKITQICNDSGMVSLPKRFKNNQTLDQQRG